jgi:rod shape determining protein RodA
LRFFDESDYRRFVLPESRLKTLRQILLRVLTTHVAWPILISISLLCTVSLFALDLASPERAGKQQIWLIIGVGVILIALLPHYQMLGRIAWAFYGFTLFLLVAVFFAPEWAFTHRWFTLPGGVLFQPSELAKISFVLVLAWYLRHRKDIRTLGGLVVPFILALIPALLILEEPDLGTALLFPTVLYAMLVAARARMKHLVLIALVALLALPGAFPFLRPYQQSRVMSQMMVFMGRDDEAHRNGPGYQAYISTIAIASGGMTGHGGEGGRAIAKILPEAYTDFIYAVVGAEWGFLGCTLVLLFYLGFFAASVEIAGSTRDMFGRILVVGLACMILSQATINLYMTIRLVPVVGVALPFVSYGGSSLLASLLAAGLLLNVSVRRNSKSQ